MNSGAPCRLTRCDSTSIACLERTLAANGRTQCETPQPIHYDDSIYPSRDCRLSISFRTMVAVGEFTGESGGTR